MKHVSCTRYPFVGERCARKYVSQLTMRDQAGDDRDNPSHRAELLFGRYSLLELEAATLVAFCPD